MIRVIRLLEYTYASQAECDKDMARWYVPPVGVRGSNTIKIRSSVTFPEPLVMPDVKHEETS